MSNLTLSIPEELREKMRKFPEINWSEVARQAIRDRARVLDEMNRLLSKSRLSEEDVAELSKEIRARVWRRRKR